MHSNPPVKIMCCARSLLAHSPYPTATALASLQRHGFPRKAATDAAA